MDSGLALRAPRNDGLFGFRALAQHVLLHLATGIYLSSVIPGRAAARTRNLEIPGSMLRIAPE
jgi:hypothetical protein